MPAGGVNSRAPGVTHFFLQERPDHLIYLGKMNKFFRPGTSQACHIKRGIYHESRTINTCKPRSFAEKY